MSIGCKDEKAYYKALMEPLKQWEHMMARCKTLDDYRRIRCYMHGAWVVMVHLREEHMADVYADAMIRLDGHIFDIEIAAARANSLPQ